MKKFYMVFAGIILFQISALAQLEFGEAFIYSKDGIEILIEMFLERQILIISIQVSTQYCS